MTYKTLYLQLVAAIDDALALLERGKIIPAIALLQNALNRTDEAHLSSENIPEK